MPKAEGLEPKAETRQLLFSFLNASIKPLALGFQPQTGSCWLRQWKLPKPQIISVESSPVTFRSVNNC